MKIEFEPKICKEGLATGKISINMPNYIERKKILKGIGFSVNSDGKINLSGVDAIDFSIKIVELTEKYIEGVNISFGNTKINSWQELLEDPRCDSIIEETSQVVLNGVSLGKN